MSFVQILILIASIMIGEVGILDDADAATAIGFVIKNRVASTQFPNTYAAVIEQGFYGWADATDKYIGLAYGIFIREDPTDGCLYALSQQDRVQLGFRPGDIVYGSGTYQLHLYHRWPEKLDEPSTQSRWHFKVLAVEP